MSFPFSFVAEMDGVSGAVVVAGIAVGAVSVPVRATVFQGDVMQRAYFRAEAAGGAVIGGMKRAVAHPFVERFANGV